MKPRRATFAATIVLMIAAVSLQGGVRGTKHDLSTVGMDPNSDQVCAFCHTPHHANRAAGPLWNRFVDQTKVFQTYTSPTMTTSPEQPANTNSMLCLGCHDGTLGSAVVGNYGGSDKHDLVVAPGGTMPDTTSWPNCQRCHPDMYGGPPVNWIGLDLRDDHPINMMYPTTAQNPHFRLPPDLSRGWANVPLFAGRVECATCHDPHDATNISFLRIANAGSALCVTCHTK